MPSLKRFGWADDNSFIVTNSCWHTITSMRNKYQMMLQGCEDWEEFGSDINLEGTNHGGFVDSANFGLQSLKPSSPRLFSLDGTSRLQSIMPLELRVLIKAAATEGSGPPATFEPCSSMQVSAPQRS